MDGIGTSCGEPPFTDLARTQIFMSSVPEPSLPLPIPHLGKYSAMFTSRILDWDKSPMEGTNRRKSRAAYGQRCNPKRENSTWRNTCHRIDMVAAVRSGFPPKRLQAGSANVDKGSSVAVQANISNSKAVESYNSCRYWGGETVHLIWSQKIVPWEQDGV